MVMAVEMQQRPCSGLGVSHCEGPHAKRAEALLVRVLPFGHSWQTCGAAQAGGWLHLEGACACSSLRNMRFSSR